MTETITFEALKDGVKQYKYLRGATKARGVKLVSVEGASLKTEDGTLLHEIQYIFEFAALKKNQKHTLKFYWSVEDLAEASFFSIAFLSGFESISYEVDFPKKLIRDDEIMVYAQDILTSGIVCNFERLPLRKHPTDTNKKRINWEVGKNNNNFSAIKSWRYTMQWNWDDGDKAS